MKLLFLCLSLFVSTTSVFAAYSESDLEGDYKALRDVINKTDTPEKLDQLIVEQNSQYEQASPDRKFVIAHLSLLRSQRGVISRLRPLFEANSSVHSFAVSFLKRVASSIQIYLPRDQWKAGFQYIVIPSPRDGQHRPFHKIRDYQEFLLGTIPDLQLAIKRLEDIASRIQKPIIWDHRLSYGAGSFPDSLDRFRTIGPAEILSSIASLEFAIHSIQVFAAYRMDELLDISQALGRLAGVNGFESGGVRGFFTGVELGVTARDTTEVFNRNKYRDFMTLQNKGLMQESFVYLQRSIIHFNAAWEILKSQKNSNDLSAFINPFRVQLSERAGDYTLKTLLDMLNGETDLRSVITGATVRVNLKNFFLNPPQDLKAFLPTRFDDTPNELTMRTDQGTLLTYRNYNRGRAIEWNNLAWRPYIWNPHAAQALEETSPFMGNALRVLSQSWGGEYISPVLDFFHSVKIR